MVTQVPELITQVGVRHHQVDQPAVVRTGCTGNAKGTGLAPADRALGVRWPPGLAHRDPFDSGMATVAPYSLRLPGPVS